MQKYEATTDWITWLYNWQSLIGSAFTGLVALVALIWAARQFIAADKQAATAAARALRDQLIEYEAFLRNLDEAQKAVASMSRDVNRLRAVAPDAALVLAKRIDRSRWALNEKLHRLKERSGFVSSPAQKGFEKAASDLFNVSQVAVLQLETHNEGIRQVRGVGIPDFPNGMANTLDQLIDKLTAYAANLRAEIRDDISRARREISRYMQRVVGG
jgi:hypothetical protein